MADCSYNDTCKLVINQFRKFNHSIGISAR